MSPSSDAALAHLKRIRPNEGWGVETMPQTGLVRLTRRNVPVTDSFFLDLHYSIEKDCIVGILTNIPHSDGTVQAQKLVEGDGKLVGGNSGTVQLVSVYYNPKHANRTTTTTKSATTTRTTATGPAAATTTATSHNNNSELSNEQNQDIVKYGIAAIFMAMAVRVLTSSLGGLIILVLPLLFLYLLNTCPSLESFDAKKELKRVLRGYHLPESHPEKPKGFFEQTLARITATVATELVTLPGYTVRIESFAAGACVVAVVVVPGAEMTYYWLGAAHRWYYIYGSPNNHTNSRPMTYRSS